MANGTITMPAFGNGSSYVKIADGTLVQWGIISVNVPSNAAYLDTVITYPVEFDQSTVNPCVVVGLSPYGIGTDSASNVCIPSAAMINGSTRFTSFTLRVWKQASVATAGGSPSPVISWVAIGRWK